MLYIATACENMCLDKSMNNNIMLRYNETNYIIYMYSSVFFHLSNLLCFVLQEVLSILFQLFDRENEKVLIQEQWIQSLKERLL